MPKQTSSTLTVLNIGQNYHITGGSDRYLFSLGELLESKGHEVVPFAAKNEKNLPSKWSSFFPNSIDFNQPKASALPSFLYSKDAAQKISRLVDASHPDIAHLHIYYGKITSSILSKLKKKEVPIIQTLHEYKPICPVYTLMRNGKSCEACSIGSYWRCAVNKCNRGSLVRSVLSAAEAYASHWLGANSLIDHFITVSDYQRDIFIRNGLPAEKITTIHNFIDVSGIKPTYSEGEYMLFFGRLERVKGIFVLLEAASKLPNIPFLYVGEGNDAKELKNEIKKRELKNVEMLPFQDRESVNRIVSKSVCSIMPSIWPETFGLTLVETFALGKPAIITNIGGMIEIVEDGVNGYIVPTNDADSLANKIESLWNDRGLAMNMGRNGRKQVEAKFSPELHYERMMNLYNKVLYSVKQTQM